MKTFKAITTGTIYLNGQPISKVQSSTEIVYDGKVLDVDFCAVDEDGCACEYFASAIRVGGVDISEWLHESVITDIDAILNKQLLAEHRSAMARMVV